MLVEPRLMRICSWSALHPVWFFARRANLVQTVIRFGILLLSINDSSRHEVIVQCILFGVEHDEPQVPSEVRITLEASQSQFFDHCESNDQTSWGERLVLEMIIYSVDMFLLVCLFRPRCQSSWKCHGVTSDAWNLVGRFSPLPKANQVVLPLPFWMSLP